MNKDTSKIIRFFFNLRHRHEKDLSGNNAFRVKYIGIIKRRTYYNPETRFREFLTKYVKGED